jgi:3-oxoadipate enol-lactonase
MNERRVAWPRHVVDEGDPSLPTVVFLHAFPYHAGMWRGQLEALRGQARCVAYDARGMGPGATASPPFMLEHMVDDLLGLLDRLALSRVVLCGLSLGGYVALRAVQRAPERISGLLLADTQAGADSDEAKLARAQGLRALAEQGVSAFAAQQLTRQLSPHTRAERPELVAHLARLIEDSSAEGIAGNLVALSTRTDLRSALVSIHVPTSVVVGADDVITPPALVRTLSESIAGAQLFVLDRAGHLSNLEAGDEFNRVLLALLARVRAA